MEATKMCPGCKKHLPFTADYFYRSKSAPTGLTARCRDCRRLESREKRKRPEVKKRIRDYNVKWNKSNPGYNLSRTDKKREWTQLNRDKYLASSKKRKADRRAREARATGSFTADDLLIIYDRQNGNCFWCLNPLNGKYHADHLIPLSRGGSNYKDNIVASCAFCNQQRGGKTKEEYLDYLTRLLRIESISEI